VVVLAVIGLLFVAILLVGGLGGHGPRRHTGAAATAYPAGCGVQAAR